MADDIKVGIGVDASGVKSGMSQVKKELDDLKKKTKEGFFDLEGERRVERNLGAMVKGLADSKNAADAFASSLDSIENVFKSSIGASVAVAGLVVLVSKYNQVQEAAKKAAAEMAQIRDFIGNQGKAPEDQDIAGMLKQLNAEKERLSGFWTRIFSDNAELKDARKSVSALIEGLGELKKTREDERSDKVAAEEVEAVRKAEEEKADIKRQHREDENAASDRYNKEREEREKKTAESIASFYAEKYKDAWKAISDEATKQRAEIDKKEKEALEARIKRDKEAADERLKNEKALADEREKLAAKTADRNKEYREKIIAEELKSPGQRNEERNAARQSAAAEDRAIARLSQKAQDKQNSDWRNARMTDAERDKMAKDLKDQRKDDKRPQMEKDISEINQTIKNLEKKIAVK